MVLAGPTGSVWAQNGQLSLDLQMRGSDQACSAQLGGAEWPIRVGDILYDVVLEKDVIEGLSPVVVRTPLDIHGEPLRHPDGSIQQSKKPLMVDKITGALNASVTYVQEVMTALIVNANRNPYTTAFVFIDINDLGRVNYFDDKQVAGDLYLKRVAESVRLVCADADCAVASLPFSLQSDWVFRDGGDEIVLMISNVTPEKLQKVLTRIADNLDADQEARALFEKNRTSKLNKLLKKLRDNYSLAVVQEVERVLGNQYQDFEKTKEAFAIIITQDIELLSIIEEYFTAERLSPTVSMGSVMIGPNDTYVMLKGAASDLAATVKREYKRSIGLDTKKYGNGETSGRRRRARMTRPEIRPPLVIQH